MASWPRGVAAPRRLNPKARAGSSATPTRSLGSAAACGCVVMGGGIGCGWLEVIAGARGVAMAAVGGAMEPGERKTGEAVGGRAGVRPVLGDGAGAVPEVGAMGRAAV